MSRPLANRILLCCAVLMTSRGRADPALEHDYEPPQRKRQEVLEVTTETEYRLGTHIYKGVDKNLEKKIIEHSYQQIECSDAGETSNVFDKPLPIGWLYSSFSEATTWMAYFDTNQQEHWVLPNAYCGVNRMLAAISWMRSGRKGAAKENKDMAWRFREHKPPFYANKLNEILNNKNTNGVYCSGWQGWLFEKNMNRKQYIDTIDNDELFTMLNIHCHNHRVTAMQHGYAGDNRHHPDASDKPFSNISATASTDGSISCSWQGWLLKDGTDGTYNDKDGKTRWNYEKYFALDTRGIGDRDKRRVHGRVINPFCSKAGKDGKVTRIRAYCFYPSNWESKQTCASL